MTLLTLSIISSAHVKASDQPLETIEKVQGGYFLSDDSIISLANYIQELQAENVRLHNLNETLTLALNEERTMVQKLLDEKDYVIELQRKQIEDLKFVYENSQPSLLDKAYFVLGGAGVAAAVILLAQAIQ